LGCSSADTDPQPKQKPGEEDEELEAAEPELGGFKIDTTNQAHESRFDQAQLPQPRTTNTSRQQKEDTN